MTFSYADGASSDSTNIKLLQAQDQSAIGLYAQSLDVQKQNKVLAQNENKEANNVLPPALQAGSSGLEPQPKKLEEMPSKALNYASMIRTEKTTRHGLPPETKTVTPENLKKQARERVAIYSSEDVTPNPRLALQGPNELFARGGKIEPAQFFVYSNYNNFIKQWRLRIYRAEDSARRMPIFEKTSANLMAENPIKWDGKTADGKPLKGGEQLIYTLEVDGLQGGTDKVGDRSFVVNTRSGLSDEEIKDLVSAKGYNWYQDVSKRDDRVQRGIVVNGTLITIHGRNLKSNMDLNVENIPVKADETGLLKVETHQLPGEYEVDVNIGKQTQQLTGNTGKGYFFLAALADVTAGKGRVHGGDTNFEAISQEDQFDEDIYVDGRLAYYLKAKVKGKYLITSQMDTREGKLSDIFDDFIDGDGSDTDSLLERIDPDRYYPVYGDGSTIIDDVDTQGKFYVRVDWDHSKVLWGNYNTNMTGTDLGAYNRTLYGAQLDYRSVQKTKHDDHKVEVVAFASEPNSMAARDEFLGTGGSQYYLRHQDVVIGSEKLFVEIRDVDNGRILDRITLQHGPDYEFNAAQGRILLRQPLSSYADRHGASIVQSGVVNADRAYLVVAYEYETNDLFDEDNINGGGRVKVWLTNFLGIGAMHVREEGGDDDFTKTAGDITLKLSNNSYINVEYATSDNTRILDYNNSFDGGLSQRGIETTGDGEAYSVNMRLDLQDVSRAKGIINIWTKDQDAGFESFNRSGVDYTQYGAEANILLSERVDLKMRHVQDEVDGSGTETTAKTKISQLELDYRITDLFTIGAEYRRDETNNSGGDTDRKDYVGIEGSMQVTDTTRLYARAQKQFNEDGLYKEDGSEGDTQYTVGIEQQATSRLRYRAELSDGGIGTGVRVGANYNFNDANEFYANLDFLDSDRGGLERGLTLGQRSNLSNKLSVYQEYQFDRNRRVAGDIGGNEDSFDRVWGFRYQLNEGWSVGGTYELSDVDLDADDIERQSGSLRFDYNDRDTHFSNRFEMRKDRSLANEDTDVYLYAGRLRQIINDEWTYLGRLDWSQAETDNQPRTARYADVQAGMAYRPRFNDKLNMIGLYRYIYDLNPDGQAERDTDEKSHIFSIDGVYELSPRWELGGKLAYKTSQIREDRDTGDWIRSEQNLEAVRLRYHLIKQWDILGEYRRRDVLDGGTSQGFLTEVGYHIGDHMRASVGYNFTDFSDDLGDDDYDRAGWFVNLVGKY